MKMYQTKGSLFPKIQSVEVDRQTESSVWIDGRRSAKRSTYECYFDSWDDAHAHLVAKAQSEVDIRCRSLERANGLLGNIKGMKKPEGA